MQLRLLLTINIVIKLPSLYCISDLVALSPFLKVNYIEGWIEDRVYISWIIV